MTLAAGMSDDDLAALIQHWPVLNAAAAVTSSTETLGTAGDHEWTTRIASVSKLMVGYAALVAIEEETIELDEPAGPPGSTVRHLLAHASGLAFDDDRILAEPGKRRMYSNTGIERFAAHLADRADMPFGTYLRQALFEPLGMSHTSLRGSPAHDVYSSVDNLLLFARELLRPTLITAATLAMARRPHFPDLKGALPGVGSFDPNPWGLTFEVKGAKDPHWTGTTNSAETFGHFGGSGSFLWVDPQAQLAAVSLSDREFDGWGLDVWPAFSDAVLDRYVVAPET